MKARFPSGFHGQDEVEGDFRHLVIDCTFVTNDVFDKIKRIVRLFKGNVAPEQGYYI